MTSLAFIFGVLPLFLAMGAGANARHSIGTGIIGGMIGASSLALMYVPLFFYLLTSYLKNLGGRKMNRFSMFALTLLTLFFGCMVNLQATLY